VGLSVSLGCLALHLAISAATPRLRNLPAMNLASLCVALLLFYCILLVRIALDGVPYVKLDIVMYYSLLATFCWMLVIAFDVWNAIWRSTKRLQSSSGENLHRECVNTSVNKILTCFSHMKIRVFIHKWWEFFPEKHSCRETNAFGEFKSLMGD
jgi:hypothetical protein